MMVFPKCHPKAVNGVKKSGTLKMRAKRILLKIEFFCIKVIFSCHCEESRQTRRRRNLTVEVNYSWDCFVSASWRILAMTVETRSDSAYNTKRSLTKISKKNNPAACAAGNVFDRT